MNNLPRQKLVEIVAKHGVSVVENPRRCEGLLRDYCGKFRREVSVLTMALEERVAFDLLAAKNTPRQVLLNRLMQRLCDNLALSEAAARWAVNSWAFALGVVSSDELKIIEQQPVGQAQTAATVVPTTAKTATQNKVQPNKTSQTASVAAVQKTVIVSANGSGDFAQIGEALRNVAPNTRLIIRPGLYNESIVIDKNVEIVGDGEPEEIKIVATNSSCLQMQSEKAIVRGLTLRGSGARTGRAFFAVDIPRGELFLEDCDINSDSLSCLAVHGSYANPLIKRCRIHDGADSGVYFFDNARGQIENCDIYRNANVGAAITNGANPTIKNCRFFEGKSGGVVAWQNGATGVIEDCKIFDHRLANVGISEYANPTFRRCEIYGSTDAGVFVHQNGYGTLEECDIYGNEDAEVAVSTGGNPVLRRCAIHDGHNSGVIVRDKGRALIENCNVYDNADAGVAIYGESVVTVRRCNIHRNGKVAIRVKEASAASVEDCDLRGNRIAAWESEAGVVIERKGNRE
ncbi:MAG: right-handed parallel beta-helix repeat-containing protein [Acidobacteria bacterium]|jgi:parallel beta-helix repeat protein|nr:right-handed parallel beta-helix repeat-containing protein [Acidobacteriota bacterium]